jgi:hypothetical protein
MVGRIAFVVEAGEQLSHVTGGALTEQGQSLMVGGLARSRSSARNALAAGVCR